MKCCIVIILASLLTACGVGESSETPELPVGELPPTDSTAADTAEVIPLPPPVPTEEVLAPGPYGVGEILLELEDPTRSTPPNGSYESSDTRLLSTVIWYPTTPGPGDRLVPVEDAAPDADGGPWPLVVYNHGFSSRNDENAKLAAYLASRGFVVAAPDFPLTNIFAPGKPTVVDMINQPGDVRFIMDHLTGDHPDANHPLLGQIDEEHIGLAGVSLGAMTALAVTFHTDFQDPRIRATAVAAPPGCYLAEEIYDTAEVPLLILHGTGDAILTYPENGPSTWARANPPKYFLTLDGGTHTSMAGLAMPLMEVLGNTDDVGCQTMEDNPSLDPDALAGMSSEFGGVDFATVREECPAPCSVTVNAPMMDPHRQLDLVHQSMIAFFVARLQGDDRYEAYLREGLVGEEEDVTLVFAP